MNSKASLRKAFFRIALITSPLFGLIGGAPLFVFSNYFITPVYYLLTGISLVLWIINISLFEIIRKDGVTETKNERILRITLSCILTIALHYVIFRWFEHFAPHPPPHPHGHDMPPPGHFPGRRPGRHLSLVQPMIFGLAFNIIQLIIMDLIQLRAAKLTMQNELNKLKTLEMEARHNNLIEQLNPHFLFNSLNTLKSFIGNEPDKAKNYLVRLSGFLRKSIADQANIVSVQQELQICSDYLELQKMRFPLSIITEINLNHIDIAAVMVPRFSIQTLIENAIKHNIISREEPLTIKITGDSDYITVMNSVNRKRDTSDDSQGTGLQNLRMRYEILQSEKEIIVERTEAVFKVSIPLLQNKRG